MEDQIEEMRETITKLNVELLAKTDKEMTLEEKNVVTDRESWSTKLGDVDGTQHHVDNVQVHHWLLTIVLVWLCHVSYEFKLY